MDETIDFIFGGAAALFYQCRLNVRLLLPKSGQGKKLAILLPLARKIFFKLPVVWIEVLFFIGAMYRWKNLHLFRYIWPDLGVHTAGVFLFVAHWLTVFLLIYGIFGIRKQIK